MIKDIQILEKKAKNSAILKKYNGSHNILDTILEWSVFLSLVLAFVFNNAFFFVFGVLFIVSLIRNYIIIKSIYKK